MKPAIYCIASLLSFYFLFNYKEIMIKMDTFLKAYKTTMKCAYQLNCMLKYSFKYTQLQTMFHAKPPILCPCHDVLFYIVKRHEYRLWCSTLVVSNLDSGTY